MQRGANAGCSCSVAPLLDTSAVTVEFYRTDNRVSLMAKVRGAVTIYTQLRYEEKLERSQKLLNKSIILQKNNKNFPIFIICSPLVVTDIIHRIGLVPYRAGLRTNCINLVYSTSCRRKINYIYMLYNLRSIYSKTEKSNFLLNTYRVGQESIHTVH